MSPEEHNNPLEDALYRSDRMPSRDEFLELLRDFQAQKTQHVLAASAEQERRLTETPPLSKEIQRVLQVIEELHKQYPTSESFMRAYSRIYDVYYMLWHEFKMHMVELSPVVPAAGSHKSRLNWTKKDYFTFVGQLYPHDNAAINEFISAHEKKMAQRHNAMYAAELSSMSQWKDTLKRDIPKSEWDEVTVEHRAVNFGRMLMKKYGIGLMQLARILNIRGTTYSHLECFRVLYNFVWVD